MTSERGREELMRPASEPRPGWRMSITLKPERQTQMEMKVLTNAVAGKERK